MREIYYFKPLNEKKIDIICVVLDKKQSHSVSFCFKKEAADKQSHTVEYLKKKFIHNKYNYKPMSAKIAKELIVSNDFENLLPTVQLVLPAMQLTMF